MENNNYNPNDISPSYNKPYTPTSKNNEEEIKLFMKIIDKEREENPPSLKTRSNLSRFLK
ncbi:MAG: hypothetical protein ACP5NZ_02035 [Nanobdellota archaeon]